MGGLQCTCSPEKQHHFLKLPTHCPRLLLAYASVVWDAISGDGDWGIPNPTPNRDGCRGRRIGWAYAYPNNVNASTGPVSRVHWQTHRPQYSSIPAFEGTNHLDPAVFPTPIYETTAAVLGFAFFGACEPGHPWQIFAYLMFNGFERFWVEKIRVNTTFDLGHHHDPSGLFRVHLPFRLRLGVDLQAKRSGQELGWNETDSVDTIAPVSVGRPETHDQVAVAS